MGRVWAIALLACGIAQAQVPAAAPVPDLLPALREEVITVTKAAMFNVDLEATYFRPPGDGPFPLVVINHGKAPGNPRLQGRARYTGAAREFVQRGWAVVVPMRQGFSKSAGSYIGSGCNVHGNGLAQAEDVRATIEQFRRRPEIDASRILVVGQSHGGLTTLAVGTLNIPGVRGLVNFAGGLRQEDCVAWQNGLARAFGSYGSETRVPALFFYGDNDSFWPPETWQAMVARYNEAAGAKARVVAFGVFGTDAHGMFGSRQGVKIWLPELQAFLRELNLPFDKQFDIALVEHAQSVPAASGFAPLDQAVPGGPTAQAGYRNFLEAEWPRAFALGANGAWSWRAGVADAMKQALERCTQRNKDQPCQLYAVDDQVVWRMETSR